MLDLLFSAFASSSSSSEPASYACYSFAIKEFGSIPPRAGPPVEAAAAYAYPGYSDLTTPDVVEALALLFASAYASY